jgi:hypothetical protein
MATFDVNVQTGVEQRLLNVSAGQARVYIRIDSSADVDLRMQTASGTLLLDYDSMINFGDTFKSVNTTEGSFFDVCVDACDVGMTVGPFYDGSTYDVVADYSYSNEYVYIEYAAEDLIVSSIGYGSGVATVSLLYDCPDACCSCAVWTEPPTATPAAEPTSAYPT